jgi:nitrate reductase NapE component
MTSSVVSARAAAEHKSPSTVFIVALVAALGLCLALAVAFVSGPGFPVSEDAAVILPGP